MIQSCFTLINNTGNKKYFLIVLIYNMLMIYCNISLQCSGDEGGKVRMKQYVNM